MNHDFNFHFRFYVFRSWGRVGTTIGGTKLEDFGDLTEAKESFKFQFADKTGNRWSKRKEFAKKAGKMQGRDSTEKLNFASEAIFARFLFPRD